MTGGGAPAASDLWSVEDDPHGIRRPVLWVDGARNADGHPDEASWYEICAGFREPLRVHGRKVDAPGWLPVAMVDGQTRRKRENVARLWALVVDFDGHDGLTVPAMLEALRAMPWTWLLHTTWSHSPEKHKARVVFPFAQMVDADKWAEVWASGAAWARTWGGEVDQACKDPSRLYFAPALPAGEPKRRGWYRFDCQHREMLTWRWLVAHHRPPKPKPIKRAPLASAGRDFSGLEREERRRRRFAQAVVRNRCESLAAAAPGKGQIGRNMRAYYGGIAVGQLVAAKVLEEADGYSQVMQAAEHAGLSRKEAHRAITNGIAKGKGDPWSF